MPGDRFNRFAKLYDLLIHPKDEVVWLGYLNENRQKILLDLGGGTGRLVHNLLDSANIVILADHSLEMLRCSKFRQHPKTRFVCCDLNHLPFLPNAQMNMVMVDTLHHVYDAETCITSLLMRLNQGCVLILEEPDITFLSIKLIAFGERLLGMKSVFHKKETILKWIDSEKFATQVFKMDNNFFLVVKRV